MNHLDRDGLSDQQKFGDIPSWMRFLMIFIDRVGFPILAFLLMSYMSFVSIARVTDALLKNTELLVSLKASVDTNIRPIVDDWKRKR